MKTKITEQSIRLFEKKGFSQTSIQDIVDSLEVTKGTFYYYFSSKEELLMDIHLHYIDDLLNRQQQIITDGTLTYKEKIKAIVYLLIHDIKTLGPSARVFFREMRHLNEEHIAEIKQKRAEFRLNIEQVLKDGVACGEFKADLNAPMVTFGILGITNYSYQWYKPNGKVTDEELTDVFVDLILSGIAAEK